MKIDPELMYLLNTWNLIRRRCTANGMAPVRITWVDLEAYQRVSGIELDAFEIESVMAMESAVDEYRAEQDKKKGK